MNQVHQTDLFQQIRPEGSPMAPARRDEQHGGSEGSGRPPGSTVPVARGKA
jgi:hypothetical protein